MSTAEAISKTEQAIVLGRTIYKQVLAQPAKNKDGLFALRYSTNKKLGKKITKGWASGLPLFTLTLEERATCPTSCHHWADCYGNNMPFAKRFVAGPALEDALRKDVAKLAADLPNGFMVRLHVLGDFYSVEYVNLWTEFLQTYAALHVFGYTARHDCAIGQAVQANGQKFWRRWMVRQSGLPVEMGAVKAEENIPNAVVCPEQTGRVKNCGGCGLCWTMRKPVAFLTH